MHPKLERLISPALLIVLILAIVVMAVIRPANSQDLKGWMNFTGGKTILCAPNGEAMRDYLVERRAALLGVASDVQGTDLLMWQTHDAAGEIDGWMMVIDEYGPLKQPCIFASGPGIDMLGSKDVSPPDKEADPT